MALDPGVFPHAAAYVARLPAGLLSYPRCRVKAEGLGSLMTFQAQLTTRPGLPGPARDFLTGRNQDEWVPEALGCALLLMVRDRCFDSDQAFLNWTFEDSVEIFKRPFYRALMYVLSPAMLVVGAARRWGLFHEGSSLTPAPIAQGNSRYETNLTLEAPEYLFSGLVLDRQTQAFLAAMASSRARNPRVVITNRTATKAVFTTSWDA